MKILLAAILLTGCAAVTQVEPNEQPLTVQVGHKYVIDHQAEQDDWEYNYDKPIVSLSQLPNGDIQLVPTAVGHTDIRLERPNGSVAYTFHVTVQAR